MFAELNRFFLFLLILSLMASSISTFRSIDKQFLYADTAQVQETSSGQGSPVWSWISEDYPRFLRVFFFEMGGESAAKESVFQIIKSKLTPTLHLALFSLLFGVSFGIFFGLIPLQIQSNRLREFLKIISDLILSTPVFVIGVLLLILFFYEWELLPPGGYESGNWLYVILPGIALGSRIFARLYLYISCESERESLSTYTFVLRTRGYQWSFIVWNSILRKLAPMLVVFILLDFGSLLSGAMVVEELFFFPGIGKTLYYAIKAMDTDLLASLLMYSGVLFYLFNRLGFYIQRGFAGERNET